MRPSLLLLAVVLAAAAVSADPSGPVQVNKKSIDSPLDDIQWADTKTLFVLSEQGVLYRSSDGGVGWVNQQTKLHAASSLPTVRSVHISRADPRKVFLLGTGTENWYSEDMGQTYKSGEELDFHEVRMHPRQSRWLLAASMSSGCRATPKANCNKIMYVSTNLGQTWKKCTKYAVQFDWAPQNNSTKSAPTLSHDEVAASKYKDPEVTDTDKLIYATINDKKKGNQKFGSWDKNIHFYASYDFFKTANKVVPHGNRFLFGDYNYLFVAAVNPHRQQEVSLQISNDEGLKRKFKTALLPVELTEHSYTILDTSEGTVFLHVNHAPFEQNAATGHVYISDWSGVSYSLSLPFNHRAPDGKCDFEKVEGLEGIYLANFIDETDDTNGAFDDAGKKGRPHAKTVITFDKGGIWSYLEPPSKDSKGQPIDCGRECHLHLHGITDLYGPFYSSATATGIIMGTGTIGSYLQESLDKINTYLSRDAGLTWFEVAKGSHIYEFGDHGGLIVMAYDEGETDSIMYSWDQGVTWTRLKISNKPLQVENIIIEPEAVSQQFIVYGWQDNSGVLVYLDFSELHERVCEGHDAAGASSSDYELWTPSDGRLGGKCLLGHKVQYTRRKRTSQCFNPEKHERSVLIDNCPCTDEDFECDYGYSRKIGGTECLPDANAPPVKEDQCASHGHYYHTKGYRRVSGDTCVDGARWDRVKVPCSMFAGFHFGKAVLGILVVVVVALALSTFYKKSEFLEDTVEWVKGKLWSDYRILERANPHSMADDDFGLDDDGMQRSALLMGDDDEDDGPDDKSQFKPLPQRKGGKSTEVPLLSPPE